MGYLFEAQTEARNVSTLISLGTHKTKPCEVKMKRRKLMLLKAIQGAETDPLRIDYCQWQVFSKQYLRGR